MKRTCVFSSAVVGAVVPLAGCGSQPEPSPESNGSTSGDAGVITLAAKAEIPRCRDTRRGQVYYPESEDRFYYCNGSELVAVDLVGQPGADGVSWLATMAPAGVELDQRNQCCVSPRRRHSQPTRPIGGS